MLFADIEEGDDHQNSSDNNRRDIQYINNRRLHLSSSSISMDLQSLPLNQYHSGYYGKILDFSLYE